MRNTDKYLLVGVVGILILVVVAFVVTSKQPDATYQEEDTPDGVAHNYLMALLERDYARAFGYLSATLPGGPKTMDDFVLQVSDTMSDLRADNRISLSIVSTNIHDDYATVTVAKTVFQGGGLFDSGQYTDQFDVQLHREGEGWKVLDADRYFRWCWKNSYGCK